MPLIHVLIGTKAQYIKTAPVLRKLDALGVAYRLVDLGQHGALSVQLRAELGIRDPDLRIGGSVDITSIPQALGWATKLSGRLLSRRALLRDVFADEPGICVVHGDTPSTLLATALARRAGLRVAHLEAGLRSHRLTHPFPEELIRVIVMRLADPLFAPDVEAEQNLQSMGLADRCVRTSGNTVIDALRHALGETHVEPTGPAIATLHRVENLHRRQRLEQWVTTLIAASPHTAVRVVMHGPTEAALEESGAGERLRSAGIELGSLAPHREFTAMLARAPFVVTDGGSIQEECAILGVPTLLWRGHTERPDGLGANVVLGAYDASVAEHFLEDFGSLRKPPRFVEVSPAAEIVDHLLAIVSDGSA